MSTLRQWFVVLLILLANLLVACQAATSPPAEAATKAPAADATNTPIPTAVPAEETNANEPSGDTQATSEQAGEEPELADIIAILARAEGLEEFVAVAEQVGLVDTLQGPDLYTVLVPPTAAFEELPTAVRSNADLMGKILRSHIAEGKFLLDEMAAPAAIPNLSGDEFSVLIGSSGGTILGTNILGGDFEAQNGMIHVIDTVIVPQAIEAEVLALYEPVAGEQLHPMQGNVHIANGEQSPIAYRSTPPTSGPHYPNIAAWQFYEQDSPFRYEQLIHNLEDGGVVIYYQCSDGCPELLEQLRAFTQSYIDGGRHVIVAPNDPTWTPPDGSQPHQEMGASLVLTAWRRSLKLDTFDADKIEAFIDAFEGIDNHVR